MKRSEAIYLATEGAADAVSLSTAADLARSLGQACTLRHALSAPWIQLERSTPAPSSPAPEPQSPAWFASLLGADARRWTGLCDLARGLSQAWPAQVITLEGAPAIFWVRYARWSRGVRQRCFEYAASDIQNAGWVQNEGPAEPWEEDEEVGPGLESLLRVLGLPALEAGSDPRLTCCASETVD